MDVAPYCWCDLHPGLFIVTMHCSCRRGFLLRKYFKCWIGNRVLKLCINSFVYGNQLAILSSFPNKPLSIVRTARIMSRWEICWPMLVCLTWICFNILCWIRMMRVQVLMTWMFAKYELSCVVLWSVDLFIVGIGHGGHVWVILAMRLWQMGAGMKCHTWHDSADVKKENIGQWKSGASLRLRVSFLLHCSLMPSGHWIGE